KRLTTRVGVNGALVHYDQAISKSARALDGVVHVGQGWGATVETILREISLVRGIACRRERHRAAPRKSHVASDQKLGTVARVSDVERPFVDEGASNVHLAVIGHRECSQVSDCTVGHAIKDRAGATGGSHRSAVGGVQNAALNFAIVQVDYDKGIDAPLAAVGQNGAALIVNDRLNFQRAPARGLKEIRICKGGGVDHQALALASYGVEAICIDRSLVDHAELMISPDLPGTLDGVVHVGQSCGCNIPA